MPNFPCPHEVLYANEVAINRLAELIIRKQVEIDSLIYAKAQLSDPEWHDRDIQEEASRQHKIVVTGLQEANKKDRATLQEQHDDQEQNVLQGLASANKKDRDVDRRVFGAPPRTTTIDKDGQPNGYHLNRDDFLEKISVEKKAP